MVIPISVAGDFTLTYQLIIINIHFVVSGVIFKFIMNHSHLLLTLYLIYRINFITLVMLLQFTLLNQQIVFNQVRTTSLNQTTNHTIYP
jgi:hypothetical protein